MHELSVYELETQHGELLPEREALALWTFTALTNNIGNIASDSMYFVQLSNVTIYYNGNLVPLH